MEPHANCNECGNKSKIIRYLHERVDELILEVEDLKRELTAAESRNVRTLLKP